MKGKEEEEEERRKRRKKKGERPLENLSVDRCNESREKENEKENRGTREIRITWSYLPTIPTDVYVSLFPW